MESKPVILTRKIQLLINSDDADFKKACFSRLCEWQRICFRAANYIFTHHFLQDQLKELFYLTEDIRVKLVNIQKDEQGILTTSRENTTYQVLSNHFKGEMPMDILACLNHTLVTIYNNEKAAYWQGVKSLRNYKRDIPIPFPEKYLKLSPLKSGKDYGFVLFKIPFKTYLGKDRTDKYALLKKAMAGQLKIMSCSLLLDKGKIFLFTTFKMERDRHQLLDTMIAEASLSLEYPIIVKIGRCDYTIGNKEEFLHRRIAMQNARRRLQTGSQFTRGGHGRKRKLKCADALKGLEYRYVNQKLHLYSRKLIDLCIKHQAATLLLLNQTQKEDIAKTDQFLLQNWSYYGLKEKIEYKANKAGIMLVSE